MGIINKNEINIINHTIIIRVSTVIIQRFYYHKHLLKQRLKPRLGNSVIVIPTTSGTRNSVGEPGSAELELNQKL